MKSILITGFTPFNGESINPSYEAIKHLPNEIMNYKIIKKEIDTIFDLSQTQIIDAVKKHDPQAIILVGQAGGSKSIRAERIAINVIDANIKDNNDVLLKDAFIIKDGPPGLFSTLPLRKIVDCLVDDGIPAVISNSAGTFVCNYLMYNLLYYLKQKNINIPAGFIHVPFIFSQVEDKPETYATDLYAITRALDITIKTTIKESL